MKHFHKIPFVGGEGFPKQLIQVAGEETSAASERSRETAGLVDEASAIRGKCEEEALEEGGGVELVDQGTSTAEAKAGTVSLTPTPEAALVKAGPSGARVAGYDEEEVRLWAQMKTAALEQGSDDDEAVPGGGMRPNAWVNLYGAT